MKLKFLPDDTEQSAIYTSLHGLLNLANTGSDEFHGYA